MIKSSGVASEGNCYFNSPVEDLWGKVYVKNQPIYKGSCAKLDNTAYTDKFFTIMDNINDV